MLGLLGDLEICCGPVGERSVARNRADRRLARARVGSLASVVSVARWPVARRTAGRRRNVQRVGASNLRRSDEAVDRFRRSLQRHRTQRVVVRGQSVPLRRRRRNRNRYRPVRWTDQLIVAGESELTAARYAIPCFVPAPAFCRFSRIERFGFSKSSRIRRSWQADSRRLQILCLQIFNRTSLVFPPPPRFFHECCTLFFSFGTKGG